MLPCLSTLWWHHRRVVIFFCCFFTRGRRIGPQGEILSICGTSEQLHGSENITRSWILSNNRVKYLKKNNPQLFVQLRNGTRSRRVCGSMNRAALLTAIKFYKSYLILFHSFNMLSGAALDWRLFTVLNPLAVRSLELFSANLLWLSAPTEADPKILLWWRSL